MSALRLYFDEDTTDWDVVHALRSCDVEITTPSEAGLLKANDETQLSFAASGGYAIYTFNIGDYCRLHVDWIKAEREHSGIIIGAQQKFSVGEQAHFAPTSPKVQRGDAKSDRVSKQLGLTIPRARAPLHADAR